MVLKTKRFTAAAAGLLLTAAAYGQVAAEAKKGIYYSATSVTDADAYTRQRCVLDLYVPPGAQGFATIVWFHEGDFGSGTRTVPSVFRGRGFAVAAPDYRLTPDVTCEQAIADAAQAVAYVLRNVEGLGGDPARVFVAGSRAGGYLAALIALDKSLLAACGLKDATVAGFVSINGTACTHPAVLRERGGEVVGRVIADTLAPVRHVRRDAPPVLLVTADHRIEESELYESNAYMWRMLRVAGHRNNRLCELQGYGCDDLDMFLALVPRFVEEQCKKLDDGEDRK